MAICVIPTTWYGEGAIHLSLQVWDQSGKNAEPLLKELYIIFEIDCKNIITIYK